VGIQIKRRVFCGKIENQLLYISLVDNRSEKKDDAANDINSLCVIIVAGLYTSTCVDSPMKIPSI
jgi:hypothetical protein